MKKLFILVFLFLLVPSLAFASQKVFYDPLSDLQIVDVSGEKTKEEIAEEFGLENIFFVQELVIDETQESVRLDINGNLEKYNYIQENKKITEEKELIRWNKEQRIKQKLGLSNEDWADLKDSLK